MIITDYDIMLNYLNKINDLDAIPDDRDYGATMDCLPRKSKGRSVRTEKELKLEILNILVYGNGISKFTYNILKKDL